MKHVATNCATVRLGLAITEILRKLAKIIEKRELITFYWPPLVWAIILFLLDIQNWFSLYTRKFDFPDTFFLFLFSISFPIIQYWIAVICLPDVSEENNLKTHYYRNRVTLFSLSILGLAVLLLDTIIFFDTPFFDLENGIRLLAMLLVGTLIFVKDDRYNLIMTVVLLGLLLTYILLFMSDLNLSNFQ